VRGTEFNNAGGNRNIYCCGSAEVVPARPFIKGRLEDKYRVGK